MSNSFLIVSCLLLTNSFYQRLDVFGWALLAWKVFGQHKICLSINTASEGVDILSVFRLYRTRIAGLNKEGII